MDHSDNPYGYFESYFDDFDYDYDYDSSSYFLRALQDLSNNGTNTSGTNSSSGTGNSKTKSNDSQVLRQTLQVYGSLYIAMMGVFCFVRVRYPRLFNIRSWVEEFECDIAKNSSYGYFDWWWKVFDIHEDDFMEQCGMDSLCFVRILRLGRKLSVVGCFHACWLMPVYATAPVAQETAYLKDKLVKISTANLPSMSTRFLATVICAYTVFGYCMYLLNQELDWYTKYRHKFLQLRKPRNYAVYVAGIPEELRDGPKLATFFQQTAATSQVLEAHVALACPALGALVEQREAVKLQLEHAKAFEEKHGERETRFSVQFFNNDKRGRKKKRLQNKNKNNNSSIPGIGFVAQVDSIDMLERKLRQLTKDISFAYQSIQQANDPHTLDEHREMVMKDIEEMRHAELQQNTASRERVHDDHDMTQVEEIYHDPGDTPLVADNSAKDGFSEGVESFFLGGLARKQKQNPEREQLLDNTSEQSGINRVRINTAGNSIYSAESSSAAPSVEPREYISSRQYQEDRDGDLEFSSLMNSGKKNGDKNRSKSTATTVDDIGRTSSSESSDRAIDNNGYGDHYFQKPGKYIQMPNIGETLTGDSISDSDSRNGSTKYVNEHSGTDIDNSGRSRGTGNNQSSARSIVSAVQDAGKNVVMAGVGVSDNVAKNMKSVSGMGLETTRKTVKLASEIGVKNALKLQGGMNKSVLQAAEMGAENIKTIRQSAAAVVPLNIIAGHAEGVPLEAGFVVFKDLYTTQAALQMLHHEKPSTMRVTEAPGADEIFWPNVGLPATAQRTGLVLSLAATTGLCFFWTIPVAFVSSLTNVKSLKKKVPFLARWVEKDPGLQPVLAVIAPLLLLILQDVALPGFLMWFAAWEGHVAKSALEASVFVKYAAFILIQTFFISAISGSITAELTNILNEPKKTIDFLANALPAQSTYFLQFLLVTAAVNMGTEMLRVQPLGLAFARKFVGPNLTEKERKKRWKFLTPLEDPNEFEHANQLGTVILYFMVLLVYAPLAPVSCFFIYMMFFIMESGYRYQFTHNYPPTPDSGGKHWLGFVHVVQYCLLVAQFTLLGFLLLKKSFYAVPFMSPLLAITVLFSIYFNSRVFVTQNLPTSECVRVDQENRLKDHNFAKGVYQQPFIKEAESDEIFEII